MASTAKKHYVSQTVAATTSSSSTIKKSKHINNKSHGESSVSRESDHQQPASGKASRPPGAVPTSQTKSSQRQFPNFFSQSDNDFPAFPPLPSATKLTQSMEQSRMPPSNSVASSPAHSVWAMKSTAVLAPSRSDRPVSAPNIKPRSSPVQHAITGMEGWTKVTIKRRPDSAVACGPPSKAAQPRGMRTETHGRADAAARKPASGARIRLEEEEADSQEEVAAAKKGKRTQLLLGDLIMRKHDERGKGRVAMPVPYTVKLAAAAAEKGENIVAGALSPPRAAASLRPLRAAMTSSQSSAAVVMRSQACAQPCERRRSAIGCWLQYTEVRCKECGGSWLRSHGRKKADAWSAGAR